MTTKARFLYLLGDGLPSTVVDSQVITVIERLAERGIRFDLVCYQASPGRSEWPELRRRIESVRRRLPGRLHFWSWPVPRFLVRRHPEPGPAAGAAPRSVSDRAERLRAHLRHWLAACRDVLVLCLVVVRLLPTLWRRTPVVVHARGGTFGVALRLRRMLRRCRLLVDVRGDGQSEYLYKAAARGVSPTGIAASAELRFIGQQEREALDRSDAAQCVSEALRRQLRQSYGAAADALEVAPCVADERRFYFDEEERRALRARLGAIDDTLLIYSGSMLPWQRPDLAIRVFAELESEMPGLRLVLLTPEVEASRGYLAAEGLEGDPRVIVRSADFEDVRPYLNAADVALLLREPHPLNRVACPSKFAEYVLCGLPVLLSAGVGDLGELVEEHRLGVVLDGVAPASLLAAARSAVAMASAPERVARSQRVAEVLGLEHRLDAWTLRYLALARDAERA